MKPNPALTTKLALVFALLSTTMLAQTYTYIIKQEGGPYPKVGRPTSGLTITGTKAYGSAVAQLYQAQLSGVHRISRCCSSQAPLAIDGSGNLYGQDTTIFQKSYHGRIFMIGPSTNWKETDLYDFTGGDDGWVTPGPGPAGLAAPTESPVSLDPSGSILGETYYGGPNSCVEGGQDDGCGVLFELTNSNGTWTETVIHAFSGPPDGALPQGGLTYDATSGNYYGTTQYGGDRRCNCGTVFELSPNGNGTWSESIVYTFDQDGPPTNGVIIDAQGNLYGANSGTFTIGYVYEISGGQLSVLDTMGIIKNPISPLVMDSNGDLLGTAFNGGTYNLGTVFELTPSPSGWQETIVHSFADNNQKPTDGYHPQTGLAMDSLGNFWGTVQNGGSSGDGLFYELEKKEPRK